MFIWDLEIVTKRKLEAYVARNKANKAAATAAAAAAVVPTTTAPDPDPAARAGHPTVSAATVPLPAAARG